MTRSQVVSDDNVAMRSENVVAFRRNKRQGMTMSVVERYVRHGIPCALSSCTRCAQNQELQCRGVPLLNAQTSRILIPDVSVVSRFIELLETNLSGDLNNLVFCQTVLDALDRRNRTRTIRNVRKITADPRRSSVVFANEVFAETSLFAEGPLSRPSGESAVERDLCAVLRTANWYARHTLGCDAPKNPPPRVLILTSKDSHAEIYRAGKVKPGVEVWRLNGFVTQVCPQLQEHFNEIKDATEGADMDITDMTPLEYARQRIKAKSDNGYPDYWALGDVEDGLRAGTLIRGKIRMTRAGPAAAVAGTIQGSKQQPQGIIERNGGLPSIVVSGRMALNRACPGDTIVVRILTDSETAGDAANEEAAIGDIEGGDTAGSDEDEDSAVDQIDAGEETAANNETHRHVRGAVVYVAERKWRPFVATLQVDEAGGGSKHLAVPVDANVPKIRIHYMDTAAIADRYFVVAIDGWATDSQYPHGHFMRALGRIGDLDAEIDTILVERQIAVSQAALGFSEASLREMPVDSAANPWTPSPKEIESRRDLRDTLIFSIDPQGSQDIDDAVSMRSTSDGGFELGVHIADVTRFVAPEMATDTEAQARGTTVYLADRRFNMIPEILSEQICSLRGNRDRFAVSVVWTLDQSYNVESVWFGRTVIRSACEMYYEQAQDLLDGKTGVAGIDPAMEEVFRKSIVALAKAMRVLRERRHKNGALELASTEVKFEFHKQTKAVAEVRPKKSLEIHRVIEEAMVFANAAVAQRIHQHIPSAALLRRHRSPTRDRFEKLIKAAGTKGFSIDCSSNAALAESLRKVAQSASQSDPDLLFLAKSMATLAMQEADYFATGDCGDPAEFVHYGLALDYYTHFTSPIRRYADIVVHRQLLATLAEGDIINANTAVSQQRLPVESRQWVGDVAARLNERNRQSKLAQRESTELFQSRFIAQQTQHGQKPLVADGVIAEVRTNGLIVYVPRFGLRGPVHLRDKTTGKVQMPLSTLSGKLSDVDKIIEGCSEFTTDTDRLSIRLPINVPAFHLGNQQLTFAVFDHVKVMLRVLETRRRRAPVYLTLVSQARTATVGGAKAYRSSLPSLEKAFRVSAANPVLLGKSGISRSGETVVQSKELEKSALAEDAALDTAVGKGGTSKSKNKYAAAYKVLEKFSEMSLLETRSESQRLGGCTRATAGHST
ncbi:hypothetical protein IW140_003741 [Coemansia sp. RSA 1813]|nr:hypothetical protein EV178_003706 [Coemansia sp. RSA 1646]KAJ1768862.1 hypothetical protein LPJ74_004506 [Coemansia sp. RSA 1843]KAJ2088745.1 hypothetical protein IW138_004017 [Coemansia sp. RSA 986]KAJ2213636.1 hypothetical protein EV179_003636 [Coemansia sp. RSA 487]KAJ2568647.1 hypothetical protein IW140_003741 [Coemansia sp. RSA 1813]